MSEDLIIAETAATEEWDGPASAPSENEALYLELDGWEGPLDLLLEEVTLSVNTTAAGGNASLMAIA